MDSLNVENTAFKALMGIFQYIVMPFVLKKKKKAELKATAVIFHDILHDFLED